TLGGSSSILAHNLGILGSRVAFITCTGNDDMGGLALGKLDGSGVDLSRAITDASVGTGIRVLLPHGEHRHILTYPGTIAALKASDLDMDYLKLARHFHLSSLYLQSALVPDLPRMFRELKAAGLTLSLDTNDDPDDQWGPPLDELLSLVDLFLPNERELLRMTGKDSLESALDARAAWIGRQRRRPLVPRRADSGHSGGHHRSGRQLRCGLPLRLVERVQLQRMCARRQHHRSALHAAPGGHRGFSGCGLAFSFSEGT